jgi:hypothetical protein
MPAYGEHGYSKGYCCSQLVEELIDSLLEYTRFTFLFSYIYNLVVAQS